MNEAYNSLASRLEQTLVDLERVIARVEMQMKKAVTTDDDAYLDAAALNLHGFYDLSHLIQFLRQLGAG